MAVSVAQLATGVAGLVVALRRRHPYGSLVYFWQQADGFWEHLLAVVQGLFWPAFMVYEVQGTPPQRLRTECRTRSQSVRRRLLAGRRAADDHQRARR